MTSNEKLRMLILITTPKMAAKARELFSGANFTFLYQTHAVGTASSEVMDILGLGSAEKRMIICLAEKAAADAMLLRLHKALKIGTVNSGIAFTLPLDAASKIMLRTLTPATNGTENGKGDTAVSETKNVMIAAVVNLGYSEEVMIAARAAGAGGGTVVHSRSLSNESEANISADMTEEKDIVLIVAGPDNKLAVMNAISAKCGIASDAKGIVFSLPIDKVIGLSDE